MAHTPGPWKVKVDGQYTWVDGSKGKHVHVITANGRTELAWCGVANDYYAGEENVANARLIAAAPDLLAACKLAMDVLEQWRTDHETHIVLARAIAKATGGSDG